VYTNIIAKNIRVNGIVQGVGFRPFVYKLACSHDLKGTVTNTSYGVTIHVEGAKKDIDCFSRDIIQKKPSLAHITDIRDQDIAVNGFENFTILNSLADNPSSTLISPDISICDDCLLELLDPKDRRYRYPFVNCINCGPRYTIIDKIPYDRANTSMKHFQMCDRCQAEYDDPENRRFHAQPNACAKCGPHVTLYDKRREKVRTKEAIVKAAEFLKAGYIVAIKGLGGFHLAADAGNNDAVSSLRERKHREEKPLALMSIDVEHILEYAQVSHEEKALLESPFRPIVILRKSVPNQISSHVSPGNGYFGVMLAYTPLHYILMECGFAALVMTSGNIADEPIAIDNDEAFGRLSGIADYSLVHDRDIYLRSDDSIVKQTADDVRFIRRSRGYVPVPLILEKKVPQILSCGAELKNTVCLTKNDIAFLSQHLGDLENPPVYEFFKSTIRHMTRILDITPQIVAHDLHPDYLSTRFALEQEGKEIIPVQHHHAHIVSCMAENRITGDVIGLAFDGTGYGTDGCIWGGEVLIANEQHFTRAAHLSYVPMPGGDTAIKNPWRMAVSYLYDTYGEAIWELDLSLIEKIDEKIIKLTIEMILKRVNSPLTSSLGRLFDGIAAIIGLRNHVGYEGQAAVELEMTALNGMNSLDEKSVYDYDLTSDDICLIPVASIIRGVVDDVRSGVDPVIISAKFHFTVVRLFTDFCKKLRHRSGLNRVALSGGAFQNAILLEGFIRSLEKNGFKVYSHSKVPANDGGISLGQAVVAAAAKG
jgi:hydrogenase maturation protein HypF